jgi:hypothetical protein
MQITKEIIMQSYKSLLGTSLVFLTLSIPPVLTAFQTEDPADSEEVSTLLAEARTQAYQLSVDAATMESYTRSNLSWETHAAAITQMRAHINAAGRTLAKLEEVRKTASSWQGTAIDRIRPLLKEIASNTQTVIDYLNENPKRLFVAEYKDHIETNADVAGQLSAMIADFVNYGNTKERLKRLSAKLELATN